MAFTAKYVDLATLEANTAVFQARIAGAIANYAKFLIGQGSTTLTQANWARAAILNPQSQATQIAWQVAIDPAYSNQSTVPIDPNSVTDATLDTVVQTAINNSLLKF